MMEPVIIALNPQPPTPWPSLGTAVAFKMLGTGKIYVGYFASRPDRISAEYPNGETFMGHDNAKASPADVEWWAVWG